MQGAIAAVYDRGEISGLPPQRESAFSGNFGKHDTGEILQNSRRTTNKRWETPNWAGAMMWDLVEAVSDNLLEIGGESAKEGQAEMVKYRGRKRKKSRRGENFNGVRFHVGVIANQRHLKSGGIKKRI